MKKKKENLGGRKRLAKGSSDGRWGERGEGNRVT